MCLDRNGGEGERLFYNYFFGFTTNAANVMFECDAPNIKNNFITNKYRYLSRNARVYFCINMCNEEQYKGDTLPLQTFFLPSDRHWILRYQLKRSCIKAKGNNLVMKSNPVFFPYSWSPSFILFLQMSCCNKWFLHLWDYRNFISIYIYIYMISNVKTLVNTLRWCGLIAANCWGGELSVRRICCK